MLNLKNTLNNMEKEYDFKTPIEKTATELAKVVIDNLVENFDTFVYADIDVTDEQKAALEEKGTDFGIKLLGVMSATSIPADYIGYPIDKVIAALAAVKTYIEGTVRQMHDEILSRELGAKSPVTGTFARDCATLGDVMLTLTRVRETTDGDYFIPKKDEVVE